MKNSFFLFLVLSIVCCRTTEGTNATGAPDTLTQTSVTIKPADLKPVVVDSAEMYFNDPKAFAIAFDAVAKRIVVEAFNGVRNSKWGSVPINFTSVDNQTGYNFRTNTITITLEPILNIAYSGDKERAIKLLTASLLQEMWHAETYAWAISHGYSIPEQEYRSEKVSMYSPTGWDEFLFFRMMIGVPNAKTYSKVFSQYELAKKTCGWSENAEFDKWACLRDTY